MAEQTYSFQSSPAKTPEDQFREWMNSQSGYIGKGAKSDWWSNHNQSQANQGRLDQLLGDGDATFNVGGSVKEQTGRLEGLERAKVLTGQNPYEIGQDYQEAYGNIRKRSQLADTGSEMIRNSKAGAMAEAKNQLQQQGVKGGAALGAVSSIERAKSYDVNNQLVENQRKAEQDYLNATKANANFTTANEMNFGAMATGGDVKSPGINSNGFGTVICTELHRQGFMDDRTLAADIEAGKFFHEKMPSVMAGYLFLATPIVSKMRESKKFTKVVSFIALPWAKAMAGQASVRAAFVFILGVPLCYITGKFIGGKYAYQKAV